MCTKYKYSNVFAKGKRSVRDKKEETKKINKPYTKDRQFEHENVL